MLTQWLLGLRIHKEHDFFLTQIIKAFDYTGNVHILLGELEQGIRARERSLHFTENLYGLRHRRCVRLCAALSFSYLRLGNFSKSIKFAEKAESALQSHDTFEHGSKYLLYPQIIFLHINIAVGMFHTAELKHTSITHPFHKISILASINCFTHSCEAMLTTMNMQH